MPRARRGDFALSLVVFAFLLTVALWQNAEQLSFGNRMLGWEYGFIAEALVEGRGFSDPFGLNTGATAWMPPTLVFLQTLVFAIFGAKSTASVWVLLILKYATLSATLYLLLRLLPRYCGPLQRVGMAAVFVALLGIHPETYRQFHDVWLGLFAAVAILSAFVSLRANGDGAKRWMIPLGLLLPLTSPPLALAFLVLWLRHLEHRKLFMLVLYCMAVSTCAWTLRNYLDVKLMVPVKSNLAFDFYQANAMTPDGRLRRSTFYRHHPVHLNDARRSYAELGERGFIKHYRNEAKALLRRDPLRILGNMLHRCSNAFVFLHSVDDVHPVRRREVPEEDIGKLVAAGWASRDIWTKPGLLMPVWTSLDRDIAAFVRATADMDLASPRKTTEAWLVARAKVERAQNSAVTWLRGLALAPFPILCFGLAWANRKTRDAPLLAAALCIYCVQLLPYILITHYVRYQFPLLGLQALFVFFGVMGARDLLAGVRRPCSADVLYGGDRGPDPAAARSSQHTSD